MKIQNVHNYPIIRNNITFQNLNNVELFGEYKDHPDKEIIETRLRDALNKNQGAIRFSHIYDWDVELVGEKRDPMDYNNYHSCYLTGINIKYIHPLDRKVHTKNIFNWRNTQGSSLQESLDRFLNGIPTNGEDDYNTTASDFNNLHKKIKSDEDKYHNLSKWGKIKCIFHGFNGIIGND